MGLTTSKQILDKWYMRASTLYHAVFRLVNGRRAHEGRIEVYHAGRWGTVCDDYFGTDEGNMVCQMLGYE